MVSSPLTRSPPTKVSRNYVLVLWRLDAYQGDSRTVGNLSTHRLLFFIKRLGISLMRANPFDWPPKPLIPGIADKV